MLLSLISYGFRLVLPGLQLTRVNVLEGGGVDAGPQALSCSWAFLGGPALAIGQTLFYCYTSSQKYVPVLTPETVHIFGSAQLDTF